MTTIRDRYAIAGIGESERSKRSGKSPLQMAAEASRSAIRDAGLSAGDIDCILSYQLGDSCDGDVLASSLGIRPSYYLDAVGGGSTTEALVANAVGLIEAGICKTALIYRSVNGRSGQRLAGGEDESAIPGGSFVAVYGLRTSAEQYAMVARRHMWETDTTYEHLGHVCVSFSEYAQHNPRALLHGKRLTLDEYFETPFIVDPFRLHDCCVETDEANAFIVTTAERARELRRTPVNIMGIAARTCTPHSYPYALPDITKIAGYYAAPQVFHMAGVGPQDVDVAAIYDCFSWVVLAQLEAYGFVGRGEAGPFAADGNLGIDGRLPTNTAGGMSTEGYTNGMNNLLELVRQLRHEYQDTPRQVDGCEVGMATGWSGPHVASAMILRRAAR